MPCPLPVYAVDTPLAELRTAELLLVTTVRLFASAWRDRSASADWRGGFRAAGIERCAVPAFGALFAIVTAVARRPLELRCPHCSLLGADEGRLLHIVSLVQRQHVQNAEALLGEWLPLAAARMAMLPARGLAAAFARAGLIVPERHSEAAKLHRMASFQSDRGLVLLQ